MQFTVGLKLNEKADHVVLDAQDALAAALKVKAEVSRKRSSCTYARKTGVATRVIRRMRSPTTLFDERGRWNRDSDIN